MDRENFSAAVTAHQDSLYRLALSICGNPAEAEDAVGEAILRAWDKLPSLRDDGAFRPWIFRILTNICRTNRKRDRLYLPLEEAVLSASDNTEPGVWEIIAALEETHRIVILLFYYEEFSVKEIAKILGVTPGAVKTRLSRARVRLKEELEQYERI